MIVGIDEAGRGPVIGPMVIAGVMLEKSLEGSFKDSKQLKKEERIRTVSEVLNYAKKVWIIIVFPNTIDHYASKKKLNYLERKIVMLISVQTSSKVVADFPEKLNLGNRIIMQPKLDTRYEAVSYASVIAKVVRDYLIQLLHYKYGDFGSGYPSDPKTVEFIKKHYDEPIVRKSWKTVRNYLSKNKSLFDF